MAIDGRINVDVLFHDTDGTTSLKVVSLEDSTAYTSGKVAVVTGTCGTSDLTVASLGSPLPYRDSSGSEVTLSDIQRISVTTPNSVILSGTGQYADVLLPASSGRLSVCDKPPQGLIQPAGGSLAVRTKPGTASYTLVLYGT